ncbi:MAG: AAA family ATPase, partial [Synergistaceae bacterium]|nr:AAA family ATPase [Synergistaceae bacterium]
MYIARLQLKDFKSFGGSHELPLNAGMTAIVGPNGSGKSNILDSLRWVLGDSHSSKLRVTRQDGLIFNGSASCPKGAEASVSVQLRDGTRVCAIRRKVSLEAGSVVTVNGNRVTLAELDETKRMWQLGGDKFAFIGQGEVAEVIQQRPQARRMLLESLFGIDSYRKRREEASSRLAEANGEYLRLRTFSSELKARFDEIAPEAARAQAARELLDALDEYRRLYYWTRRAANNAAATANETERALLEERSKTREAWLAAWIRSLEKIERDVAELSNSRQIQIRELDAAKDTMAGFTRTAYGYGTSLASAARRNAQLSEELSSLAEKLDGLKRESARHRDSEHVIREELEAVKKSLAEAEGKHTLLENRLHAEREHTEQLNRERGEIEGKLAALSGRMKSLGASLAEAVSRGKESASGDPLKKVKAELEDLEKKHAELLLAQDEAASRHRDLFAKLQGASADLQRNRRELSKMTNRLEELQERAAAEIYPRPVQHILSAAKLGRIKAHLRVVIDAFSCPPELAVAMEAFLGGRQFMILTDSMDEAGICIDILKKSQMGRATFLPLERSRPRTRAHGGVSSKKTVGWVMDLVKSEEHWRPALEHIMGDLLIVEDYQTGTELVRNGFRLPVTTLDGDVFQPGGTVSGGRAAKSGKSMEMMSAITSLEKEVEAARHLVESLSAGYAGLEEEEAAASAAKDTVSAEIRELSARRSACDERREAITRERARAKNERESTLKSLRECGEAYRALVERKKSLAERTAAVSHTEADMGLIKEIEQLKGKAAIAEEKLRSGFVLSERVAAETRSVMKSLSEMESERASCDREMVNARSALSSLSRRYAEAARARRRAAEGMENFKERYDAITRRRERRTARMETARTAAHAAAEVLSGANMRAVELSREREEIIQTWEEQYPYPGPETATPENPDEIRRGIRECERSLKAMGDVDMGALSEERSLKDRLAFLGEQLDDVGGSMRELERLISDADQEARAIFTNALGEIDKKFNDLFQRLFVGGDARLDMIEGESLWDSGVDVIARPPGKHPASINQLSGGEQSLSAIALLFASLEVAS